MSEFTQKERAAQSRPKNGPMGNRPERSYPTHSGFVSGAENDHYSFRELPDQHASPLPGMHLGHDFSKIRVVDASRETMLPAIVPPIWPVQAKLAISQPGDAFEQEADRIAEKVIRMPEPGITKRSEQSQPPLVQRSCSRCKKKMRKQHDEEERLQMAPSSGASVSSSTKAMPSSAPPIVHEVLRSPGVPLDEATRAFMEPRFGHDFSKVRVHADPKAAESALAVNALAYTVGPDIVFANGGYAPRTTKGTHLLAHELTHVMQQRSSYSRGALAIDPSAVAEADANDFASRIADVTSVPRVSRQIWSSLSRALQRTKDQCSGSRATCSASDRCAAPDPGKEGRQEQSDRWELEVNIDIESSSWEWALRNKEFGHTYVRFLSSNGREYTYGFYPASESPNENQRSVAGCVHHPDTTHDACIDDIAPYSLTKEQYEAGLARAQEICRNGHSYGATYTCTTYAEEIVRASSKTLPSSRSQPTTVFYQQIPGIDNPNTLIENVQSARSNLDSDSEIRDWVSRNNSSTIGQLPTREIIRMINRLMDGFVTDDDINAIKSICRSVTNAAQMARIQMAILPRVSDLMNETQRAHVRMALGY